MQSYYLLLSAKSLIEGQEKKNYLLKIYQGDSETPYQIDNVFVHNYEYVYKLWACQFQQIETIRIKMYEKFYDNMSRQVIVKKGESQPQVKYTLEGEKYKFYGEQAEKCVLVLHFWVQTYPNLEKQISNSQLKQINVNMQHHLANCRQQLHQYQQFLTYTNKLIQELNNQEKSSRINLDTEVISTYEISASNTQQLRLQAQEKEADQKKKKSKQSETYLKNIDSQIQSKAKYKNKQTILEPNQEIVTSDNCKEIKIMENKNPQNNSFLQKQIYLSANQHLIQTAKIIEQQNDLQLKKNQKDVMKSELRIIDKQSIYLKQQTPKRLSIFANKTKQPIEDVQKKLNINQINASEQIKKRRDMYLGRRVSIQLHDQISADLFRTNQKNQVTAASNSKKCEQLQNQKYSNSRSSKRQSRLKYKAIKQGHYDDEIIDNKKTDQIQLEPDQGRMPKKIVELNFKNPINPDENSPKMRKYSISPKNEQLTNKKIIESENTNKACVSTQIQPQKGLYPSRRKKVRSKTMLAIKTNRSSMGAVEEMLDQKTQIKKISRYVDNDKDNKEVNIFITNVKAVLYTNHRRAPKKCIISLQNRTFKTHTEQTFASLIEWPTKFSLDNLSIHQNISCRVVSCDGNEQIDQGTSVMKGNDILSQNKRLFKSYLYYDELAVGYIELELEKVFPKSQTRNTVSLPEIKKNCSSDDRSDKNKSSKSKKSIIYMNKYSILNAPRYSDTQQQRIRISQKDRSHLTKLKEKKMKLRAKIK